MTKINKVIISFLLLVCLTGCFEEETAQEEIIRPIQWIKVVSSDLRQERRISGIVKAAEKAELSFEVSGKISAVNVKLGDSFKQGDILAQLDSNSYNLNSKAANAQLKQANSALVEARNEFNRKSSLLKKGWVSQSAYDDAKASLEAAKSSVDVAKVQLDLSKKDLGDTAIRAPYDGTVVQRFIEPSQQIAAGQACFEVEGKKGFEISILVPETILENLNKETNYTVSFPAVPDLRIKAKITEIGAQAEAANAFPVTLSIEEQNTQLRAGMSAEVDLTFSGKGIITGHEGSSIQVPPTALLTGEEENVYVFVYDENTSSVQKRKVLPENIIGNTVYITQGLKSGDIIATAGVVYLHDGQKVRLLNQGPAVFNE